MPVLASVAGSGDTDAKATYLRFALIAGDSEPGEPTTEMPDAEPVAPETPEGQGWVESKMQKATKLDESLPCVWPGMLTFTVAVPGVERFAMLTVAMRTPGLFESNAFVGKFTRWPPGGVH